MYWINSKGVKYYLASKDIIFGRGKLKKTNYFFTKQKPEETRLIPTGYKVSETKTGLPVLKRI